ncbi:uncharacterized protein LOC141612539 [Silene latifolia]|uniref:uncharacterized protein LOC141612539 n=1 Tax=Silene latifolia TaxID=37657 RepID=UPI003D78AC7B
MIGGNQIHELRGLSEPDSWHLFERMAFQSEEREAELVELGKEIVKKCANVPLAIRVVGSLLRGQSKSKWLSFHDKGLDYLSETNDTMTRILKLSYDQLNPSLKACFVYCALFPKDWKISKQMLVQLWMAQGYINTENLGEEYFLILLQRCFFQDLLEDEFEGIDSFKIHDLLHDTAEKIAGEEICRFSFDTSNVSKRVRHLSLMSYPHAHHIFNNTHVRTCLQIKGRMDQLLEIKSIPKWTCLRSLDWSYSEAKSLPKSIGQLLHLRSLDLSFNRNLKVLPRSITKLVNLQTLNLRFCYHLKQLPDDVSKLVDLSTLNVARCDALSCMPAGIGMLTCLQTLCQFVVGARASSTSEQCFRGLKDLCHLNKLKGSLSIQIAVLKNAKFVKEEHGGGAYLRGKEHLETLVINFRRGEEYGSKESEQELLEEMQPHHDIKALELNGYHGETIPRWPRRGDNSALFDFPNLVTLKIEDCSDLLYLPWQIGKLPHLKTLKISKLLNMEYVADSETLVSGEGSSFFPCLDFLEIDTLPKLKGWWRRSDLGSLLVKLNGSGSCPEVRVEWVSSPSFPRLNYLTIKHCEKILFAPLYPVLEHLDIYDSRGKLFWSGMRSTPRHHPSSHPKSCKLEISNLEWLKSMPVEYSQFIVELDIVEDESLGEVNEFPSCLLSSLRSLCIRNCPKLKSVGGWLEHLSALEYLRISECPEVELGGMSWHNLAATLLHLRLFGFEEMEEMPEGIQYCTSLKSLYIMNCPKLKYLPKWMPKLTSLQKIEFWFCSESLMERCQQPNGEDWPLIRHISEFKVWYSGTGVEDNRWCYGPMVIKLYCTSYVKVSRLREKRYARLCLRLRGIRRASEGLYQVPYNARLDAQELANTEPINAYSNCCSTLNAIFTNIHKNKTKTQRYHSFPTIMELSNTLSLVQTILTAIQTLGLMQSVCSISNCKSELDDLHNTVQTVRAVLEDADAKQDSLNSQEKNYIQELKDAVYDADDVLDEFLTLAKQNQLRRNKVISFFFRFKLLTHRLSSKVKRVNNRLNKIAIKSDKFSFKVDYKPLKFTKEETSSCLSDVIIGREEDVEKIVGVLLGSHNVHHPNVSLLSIMGMGGLGKTALAQLVFNDPRITEAFPLKRWTCIADQDQEQLDLKEHLAKVVKGFSVTDKMSLEDIHHRVKEQLGGKKYLLVLDDVWTESYDEWQKLEGFLKVGGRGSWIIVTTRSKTTAQMIAGDQMHELRGLSESNSWHLFERMAFQAEERDDELVKLGKEIVKKCTNVPLAIRVVGSLLRGQSKSKWLSFHEKGLDSLGESNDTITRILKLSYDQLNPSLKACFSYCAIFPKDWQISKQLLIQLWMAQGYINSENLGEDYFLILFQRCFFQDLLEDKFGKKVLFKIHDLLHDFAEKVAGGEICRISFDTSGVGKRVRHVSFAHHMNFCTSSVSDSYAQHIFNNTHIRTCLQIKDCLVVRIVGQLLASKSIPKWTCLRSLDLRDSKAKSLPKSIGKLLHLRSLDLSDNSDLKVLPKSITKLVNLQTLNLYNCKSLKQLPDDVSKLVDLSTLDIVDCDALSYVPMPAGIGMLTNLQTLCQFVVGARPSSTSKQWFYGLVDLKHLNKLKGHLKIELAVLKNAKFVKEEQGGGGYLRSKEHLENIVINFSEGEEYGSKESEQALLEEMQPHHNVKRLKLNGYHGETIPRWPGRGDNSTLFDFPNLVTLRIVDCSELLYLPWQIGKLPHLKTLQISNLPNMEYVADSETLVSDVGSSFFPCLDFLEIDELPKLKGWWRRSESGSHMVNSSTDSRSSREGQVEWESSPCFPLLKILSIRNCENMMFVPLCPQLEQLIIYDSRADMRCAHRPLSCTKLKRLEINNLEWLKSMPIEYSQFLSEIDIWSDKRMERLGEVNEFPTYLLSSVRTLRINYCPELVSIRGWLDHLSALEYLWIYSCPKVELGGISWHNLAGSLQHLYLSGLKEMEELPEGLQYCTSLQFLDITLLLPFKLKSMPKWMPKLTSLQKLNIAWCSESLRERCQKPNGEDWPLIHHISSLHIC